MKAPCAHGALAAALVATCRAPAAFAFVCPAMTLRCGHSGTRALISDSSPARRGPAFSTLSLRPTASRRGGDLRTGVRLAAARDDCKSCLEKELLAEEAAAGEALDLESRRAAFEEVIQERRE